MPQRLSFATPLKIAAKVQQRTDHSEARLQRFNSKFPAA